LTASYLTPLTTVENGVGARTHSGELGHEEFSVDMRLARRPGDAADLGGGYGQTYEPANG